MNNNGGYWKERFQQMEEVQNHISASKAREIQEQFERAQAAINGKINAWYQRFAENNGVSMAEARRMLSAQELKELQWNVEDYIRYGEENAINHAWEKQLENASARVHISRLEALKLETQQELEKLYGNLLDSVDNHIRDVYTSDFYHTAFEIQKGIGVGSSLQKMDRNLVGKIVSKPWAVDGKNFSDRIWENKTKLVNQVHNSLTRMCITGEAPDRAIREIAENMKVSRQQAGRLVMTESAAFANQAREDCMNELGVEEFEVVETLDSYTCSYCQSMDGKHFPMDDFQIGVTAPPFHPNCRGCTCPYFDDEFTEGEERAARGEDGKTYYVPSDMAYDEWKKSFVDGDKDGLQENKPMEKFDKTGYTTRTKEEFEKKANDISTDITDYSSNPSKWSGTIHIKQTLIDGEAVGVKEWSCDISIMDVADDGVVWHEMLHSCSASYYNPMVYAEHEFIEEASVEFLKLQICAEKGIPNITAYENKVAVLQALNDAFGYGTDLEFAKELFNVPLPDRYQWLEKKVDESLRLANASFQDYNEVMKFLETLKGGKHGVVK